MVEFRDVYGLGRQTCYKMEELQGIGALVGLTTFDLGWMAFLALSKSLKEAISGYNGLF